jgi:hypothetical protein
MAAQPQSHPGADLKRKKSQKKKIQRCKTQEPRLKDTAKASSGQPYEPSKRHLRSSHHFWRRLKNTSWLALLWVEEVLGFLR